MCWHPRQSYQSLREPQFIAFRRMVIYCLCHDSHRLTPPEDRAWLEGKMEPWRAFTISASARFRSSKSSALGFVDFMKRSAGRLHGEWRAWKALKPTPWKPFLDDYYNMFRMPLVICADACEKGPEVEVGRVLPAERRRWRLPILRPATLDFLTTSRAMVYRRTGIPRGSKRPTCSRRQTYCYGLDRGRVNGNGMPKRKATSSSCLLSCVITKSRTSA
ncbi:DNAH1 [Symbiodinium sp. CCMP2592]|nr:DNAH1 [Symbiodinium sp. CCMP2592]